MKLLFILLLLNISLHANYSKVEDYYKKGKYKKVLTEAKKSYDEYNNPKLHLLWAKSAEKLGHTTEAMGAYERVLILDETNTEASQALSNIYQQTHRRGLNINPYEIPSNTKWSSKVDIALGYDNNLNANPGGDALDEYYGVVGNNGPVSSRFLRLTANINYTNHFENEKGWFTMGTFNIYSQKNFSAHKYDLLTGSAEFTLGYTGENYTFYLPFVYDKTHYLDTNLLQRYRVMPRVFIPLFAHSLLDFSLNYTRNNYIDSSYTNNDSHTIGAGLGIYIPTNTNLAHFNLKYEKRTSESSLVHRFIDANFLTVDANLKHTFDNSFSAEAKYTFRYGNYVDNTGTILIPSTTSRIDYFNEIDLKLTYQTRSNITLYIRDALANNSSNYIPTEYNKNIFMFGFDFTY